MLVVPGEVLRHAAVLPAHDDGDLSLARLLVTTDPLVQVDLHLGGTPQPLELSVEHGEDPGEGGQT